MGFNGMRGCTLGQQQEQQTSTVDVKEVTQENDISTFNKNAPKT